MFYLNLDVVETNCSVLSKRDWKTCEARPTHDTPVRIYTHILEFTFNDSFLFFVFKYSAVKIKKKYFNSSLYK